MTQRVGLVMVVGEEPEVEPWAALRSVAWLVACWTIVDVGQQDGLEAAALRVLPGRPGAFHRIADQGKGGNRQFAVSHAQADVDFHLLLEPEMVVLARTRELHLSADLSLVPEAGPRLFLTPRFLRSELDWQFSTETRPVPRSAHDVTAKVIDNLAICRTTNARQERESARAEVVEAKMRGPEASMNGRTLFYLAEARRVLGEFEDAAATYEQRLAHSGWDEELFYATYQAGKLRARSDPVAAAGRLLDAVTLRPWRAEPLCALAELCRDAGWLEPAYFFAAWASRVPVPRDTFLVHLDDYRWRNRYELARTAALLMEESEAEVLFTELLEAGVLPVAEERIACGHLTSPPPLAHRYSAAVQASRRADLLFATAREGHVDLTAAFSEVSSATVTADHRGVALIVGGKDAAASACRLLRLDCGPDLSLHRTSEIEGSGIEGASVRLVSRNGELLGFATHDDQAGRFSSVRVKGGRAWLKEFTDPAPHCGLVPLIPLDGMESEPMLCLRSLAPTIVCQEDGPTWQTITELPGLRTPRLTATSPGVRTDDGWLIAALVQDGVASGELRFVQIGLDFVSRSLSPAFHASKPGEVCHGLCRWEDDLVLCTASRQSVTLTLVDLAEVVSTLTPVS